MSAATKPRPVRSHKAQAHRKWEHGLMLSKQGHWGDALKEFEQAIAMEPKDPVYLVNAAKACLVLGNHVKVGALCARVSRNSPEFGVAAMLQMRALEKLQRYQELRTFLEGLPSSMKSTHPYWSALGLALQCTGKHHEAINAFMSALALEMDDPLLHYRMGVSFYELALKEEAAECFRTCLLMGVGHNALHVHGMLAFAERENCRWAQALEQEQLLNQAVAQLTPHSAVITAPFAHVTLSDDPVHQYRAARAMSNTWRDVQHVKANTPRPAGKRVRVGYVSSDFFQHATALLISEVLEHHDSTRFEVFAYSHGRDDKSAMRQRLEHAVEHFVDVRGEADQQIAQRIADDHIDVLVDLKGYTAENRLGVFARRPAPLQVAFLGYPGTTGSTFMDYLVGDPVVTPLVHQGHFSEKIAQMPVCYQPNDRQRALPKGLTRAEVGLPDDAFVLCGFNQAYKISTEVLNVWCNLLRELPQAILWLLDWHSQARPHVEDALRARGIDIARVHWAPRRDHADHIDRLALADLFIDTWPCNAHTTASDALWAGVPVVTFMGQTFAARVAGSLLHAVGLPELVTTSVAGYTQLITRLAGDADLLRSHREHLVRAREASPLFDSKRFAHDFERLLSQMVHRSQDGLQPVSLAAAD